MQTSKVCKRNLNGFDKYYKINVKLILKKNNMNSGIELNISSKLYLSKGMIHPRHSEPCLSYVYTVSKENMFRHTALYN